MSAATLEERYRRLLAWYPRSYRKSSGPEILAVLMAGAGDGQRRPGPAEILDLVTGGLRMRLRPPGRVPGPVTAAAWLLCAGAAAQVAAVAVAVATSAGLRTAAASATGAAIWHAEMLAHPLTVIAWGAAATTAWLFLAWASRRGHDWARGLVTALAALCSLEVLDCLAGHYASYARGDLVTTLVLWPLSCAALILLHTRPASRFYRPEAVRG